MQTTRYFLGGLIATLSIAGTGMAEPAPGVADYSAADPAAIESSDIAQALAVTRGTRIEAFAPPTIRLPISFESGSDELEPGAKDLLLKVAAALSSPELEGFRFSIEGHTDEVGSDDFNDALSRRRARAVKLFLVDQGVREERLASLGHGELSPVAGNNTEEGRRRNRRVDLINLGTAE